MVQITGAIARRLVCWAKVGQYMPRGRGLDLSVLAPVRKCICPVMQIYRLLGDKIRETVSLPSFNHAKALYGDHV